MNMEKLVESISLAADSQRSEAADYINPADGLLYCGKCNTPKEAYFPAGLSLLGKNKHSADCRCAAERRAQQEAEKQERDRRIRIAGLRAEAFREIPAAGWRFDKAPIMTAQLATIQRYAERWEDFRENHSGLLLYGGVGTGKSYAAGCVANALIDRCVSVLFVGLPDLISRMQGNFGADRDNIIKQITRPELLILDDLGAERNTSYGKERLYDVINHRWLTGKPMIVTTNLTLSYLRKPGDIEEQRIFDRILEVCVPVKFDGDSFRQHNAAANLKKAADLLNG